MPRQNLRWGLLIINWKHKKIIKEDEEYFNMALPDNIKKHSNRYMGRKVIWYGNPDQMIVVNKNNVHGMWGNIYDSEKLKYVEKMIRSSKYYVEFECSYAMGSIVDIEDIIEHQNAYIGGRFYVDYEGFEEPYSTDSSELDNYLGIEDLDELDIFKYTISNPDLYKFFKKYKFNITYNKHTKETLFKEYQKYEPDESEIDAFNDFIEVEERLGDAIVNQDGDIGEFSVQLRDTHHRVMGAINIGENFVCVNLDKEDLAKYGNYVNRVTTKG